MTSSPEKTINHYFVKHPKSKPRLGIIYTYLKGKTFKFITSSGVFSKTRIDPGTRLLIEVMVLPPKGYVLDLGCGYGPVGIAAAAFNPNIHVIMVDVNKRAVKLARENARRNLVSNVEVKQGFLYKPVENMKFQAILSNPPVSAGMKIVEPIITQAKNHLLKNGTLQLVVRSEVGGKQISKLMEETFGNIKVLARKSGYRVLISKS